MEEEKIYILSLINSNEFPGQTDRVQSLTHRKCNQTQIENATSRSIEDPKAHNRV